MDNRVTIDAEDAAPVVVWANRYQFGPGERLEHWSVQSRTVLWVISGAGELSTDRGRLRAVPGTLIALPWEHDVTYLPEPADPFMLGAVHVVPWHDPAVTVHLHAAHGAHDALAGVPHRRDVDWPELAGTVIASGPSAARSIGLAGFCVDHFLSGQPSEPTLRAMAVLLMHELRNLRQAGGAAAVPAPGTMARMEEYVLSHIADSLTVRDICRVAGCSPSTAERLFRRHTGLSVKQWIIRARLERAADLLRTTNKSVTEIGRQVGYPDSMYFSRAFRQHYGEPPTAYAARYPLTG